MDSASLVRFGGQWIRGLQQAASGWAAILEGDTAGGLARINAGLERVGSYGGPAMTAPLRLQRAIVLSRRPATREEGITLLRHAFPFDPQYRPIALVAIAEALQAAGDRQGAAETYGEFLRLWDKADPSLQPRVAAAREALAALQRQGG